MRESVSGDAAQPVALAESLIELLDAAGAREILRRAADEAATSGARSTNDPAARCSEQSACPVDEREPAQQSTDSPPPAPGARPASSTWSAPAPAIRA